MAPPAIMAVRFGLSPWQALGMATAATLGAAAFPPVGLWPLSLVSLSLFLFLLRDRDSAQARQLGLLYGIVYGLGTMYWMFGIFGAVAISFVAIMAAYFGILATLVGMTKGQSTLVRVAWIALVAVGVEWFRGDAWYLRFPWYTAPHALAQSPAWIALAQWLGVYGLSFVIWFIGAAGALVASRWWLAFLLLPAGAFFLPRVGPANQTALLVQAEEQSVHERLIASVASEPVDLAVLPEYAFPFSLEKALASPRGPAELARKLGCPVVFGTVDGEYGKPGFQNVAAVIDPQGSLLGTFPKQRPVPLMLDGRAGDRRPVFPVSGGTMGIGLCYDFDAPAIAGSLVRSGATFLVAPTGDLMAWGGMQHRHHELLLRLRAVENDRWILRATSSGRTEAIDPHGVPSDEHLDIGVEGILSVRYAHRTSLSLGSYAYELGPLAASLTACFLLYQGIRALRSRRTRWDMAEIS